MSGKRFGVSIIAVVIAAGSLLSVGPSTAGGSQPQRPETVRLAMDDDKMPMQPQGQPGQTGGMSGQQSGQPSGGSQGQMSGAGGMQPQGQSDQTGGGMQSPGTTGQGGAPAGQGSMGCCGGMPARKGGGMTDK